MAIRFRDQSVLVDLPKFVAADSNPVPSSTWSRIRSQQRPMKRGPIGAGLEFIEGHDQVRQIMNESARDFSNRCGSNRRSAVGCAQRTVFGEECSYAFRVMAGPCLRVTLRKLIEFAAILHPVIDSGFCIVVKTSFAKFRDGFHRKQAKRISSAPRLWLFCDSEPMGHRNGEIPSTSWFQSDRDHFRRIRILARIIRWRGQTRRY